ncbi:MAG TPA: hypothetical protein VEK08_10430 [Planctomycetota bacterium]|nr:hypothetical protein [Planctomycetota bacterium]
MVRLSVANGKLVLDVLGWHRLWALKSRLEVALDNIRAVKADPAAARRWPRWLRCPGTYVPGVITAGSFYGGGKWSFWDVRNAEKAIVIELTGEPYDELIVEVDDPARAVELLKQKSSAT